MAVRYPKRKRRPQHAREMHALSSPTFERHIIDLAEAQSRKKGPQNLSMAWDDTYLGISGSVVRSGLMSERDKKDTHYKVYLACTWVASCVDVIAKRFTSGGWEIVPVEPDKGSPANEEKLRKLLLYVNDDEDFLQFLRSIASDLLIYGEAFCEIVPGNGGVSALHKIDCITMTTHFDKHGVVTGYTQELERSTETVEFTPETIIRWWLPDPRASKMALSPLERMKDAVYLYQAMVTYAEKFFRQGGKPPYWVQLGDDSTIDDANRYIKWYRENYTGLVNAHVPPVMYNGAKLNIFGSGSVDMDFQHGLDRVRNEILAAYGVPPALVSVIESGNIGGGTGESQEKSFQYNVVDPLKQLILEKLNYRLQKAMKIPDWKIDTHYGDYRSDDVITKIQDVQIRNGSLMVNEARSERGRPPVEGGDEAVIVTSREVTPVQRLADLADEQRQQSQLQIDMQQAQIEKLKQPPPAPVHVLPPGGMPASHLISGDQPPQTQSGKHAGNEEEPPKESLLDLLQRWREEDWLDAPVPMRVDEEESDDAPFFLGAAERGGNPPRSN